MELDSCSYIIFVIVIVIVIVIVHLSGAQHLQKGQAALRQRGRQTSQMFCYDYYCYYNCYCFVMAIIVIVIVYLSGPQHLQKGQAGLRRRSRQTSQRHPEGPDQERDRPHSSPHRQGGRASDGGTPQAKG